MTKVVNKKDYQPGEYEYVGRGSIFGNPYEIGIDGDRLTVCSRYKKHFNFMLRDERFKREVLKLKDKNLGCFCKVPCKEVECHADTIAEYLNNL